MLLYIARHRGGLTCTEPSHVWFGGVQGVLLTRYKEGVASLGD